MLVCVCVCVSLVSCLKGSLKGVDYYLLMCIHIYIYITLFAGSLNVLVCVLKQGFGRLHKASVKFDNVLIRVSSSFHGM